MKPTKITVIIPVFNIARRGYNRLDNSLYSLSKQNCKVIVSCGSWESEHIIVRNICNKYSVKCIYSVMPKFNKPILLNRGLSQIEDGFVMCTDVDYIFDSDFIESLEKYADKNTFICKEVLMLPKQTLSKEVIDSEVYINPYPNKFGRIADGACQFAHISWFRYCKGYDERMRGWAGMDNDMTKRAKLKGLNIHWLEESNIYHQWHSVEKYRKASDLAQSKLNHNLLQNDNTIIRNTQR